MNPVTVLANAAAAIRGAAVPFRGAVDRGYRWKKHHGFLRYVLRVDGWGEDVADHSYLWHPDIAELAAVLLEKVGEEWREEEEPSEVHMAALRLAACLNAGEESWLGFERGISTSRQERG